MLIPKASSVALNLITRMLSLNPNNRPTIKQIMADEFFNQKTPDSNYSYSTNDSLDNEIIRNVLKNITDNKKLGNPDYVNSESESYKLNRNKEQLIKHKDILRKKLMRINQLKNLELSNVVETDRESIGEKSPLKVRTLKVPQKKSNSEKIYSNIFHGNSILPSISSREEIRASSQNQRENLTLAKYQSEPLSLGLNNYASHGFLPRNNFGNDETNSNHNSHLSSLFQGENRKHINGPSHLSNRFESSNDELEVLRKQIEDETVSKPLNLNKAPIYTDYSSRGSSRIRNNPASNNNLDKYFMDLNGRSLIKNANSLKDLFSIINMSKHNSVNRSLVIGGNTNYKRGINAANQILFGNNGIQNYTERARNSDLIQNNLNINLSDHRKEWSRASSIKNGLTRNYQYPRSENNTIDDYSNRLRLNQEYNQNHKLLHSHRSRF